MLVKFVVENDPIRVLSRITCTVEIGYNDTPLEENKNVIIFDLALNPIFARDLLNDLGNRIVSLNSICRYMQGRYMQGCYMQGCYMQGCYIQGRYIRSSLYSTLP